MWAKLTNKEIINLDSFKIRPSKCMQSRSKNSPNILSGLWLPFFATALAVNNFGT